MSISRSPENAADSTKISCSVAEAVQRTSISRSSLYKLIGSGKLPIIKIGRSTLIACTDLLRLLEENRQLQATNVMRPHVGDMTKPHVADFYAPHIDQNNKVDIRTGRKVV